VPEVSDHSGNLNTHGAHGGLPVFWRSAPTPSSVDEAMPLYLHGVPTNSDEWPVFLARSGGLAPDLPGFGRTGKAGNLDYTIDGYADFIERYLDLVEVDRVSLIVHDWGVVGLAFAQAHPERIARLVVMNAVPFLPGYRWHRTARLWRSPLLGELSMGATTRSVMRFSTREARPGRAPMPDAWLDSVFDHFDQGTQRAILRLYLNVLRLGHMRARAHSPHAGWRAWQVRRPWRKRLTCSSSSSPGGVRASIWSCKSSKGAPGRSRRRRIPTRETCVSTGTSCRP
jgi:pimeloyl-ACP methyl ester carboxylesterase